MAYSSLRQRMGILESSAATGFTYDRVGTPISSRADLEAVVGSGNNNLYYLTRDIDLSGADWEPLPTFNGSLDMGGFCIKNMTISEASFLSSGATHAGLFQQLGNYAVVLNGCFENCTVNIGARPSNYKAVLAGTCYRSVIKEILIKGCTIVSGGGAASSLTGYTYGTQFMHVVDCDTAFSGGTSTTTGHIAANAELTGDGVTSYQQCFYNSSTWAGSGGATGVGDARTTTQLQTASTFATWNTQSYYDIVNGAYPSFKTLEYIPISDRAGLEAMCSGGSEYGIYRLTNDINLAGAEFDHLGTQFYGELDGDGFSILNIERGTAAADGALFRHLRNFSCLRNIRVYGRIGFTSTTSASYQGLICSTTDRALLTNCNTDYIQNPQVQVSVYHGGDRGGSMGGFGQSSSYVKCYAINYMNRQPSTGTRRGPFMGWDSNPGADFGPAFGQANTMIFEGAGHFIGDSSYTFSPTEPGASVLGIYNYQVTSALQFWKDRKYSYNTWTNFAYDGTNHGPYFGRP